MHKFVLFCVLFLGSTRAATDEEVKMEFIKIVMACNKDIHVEPQHLLGLQRHEVPEDPAARCLLACAYKKSGIMDDKGMYSIEGSLKVPQKFFADDAAKLESAKKFSELCNKVNEQAVSDGEKGCERSALIFKCLVENAAQFGVKI